ncbi:MAG: SdpI family protein [Candidatus Methanodesulfokora sp.]
MAQEVSLEEYKKAYRKISEIIILGIILLSFVVSIYFYPQMPEEMASHWNAQGQVDGYLSKFWGLFLMPFFLVGLALLFTAIPKIDPLKANIEKFRQYYDGFVILFFIFLLSIHFQVILWNIGIKITPNATLPIWLGLLFFYCGILCENAKRNWFIGIRTPWTLSSEKVWDKTHKIGGKLFKIAGIVSSVGVIFQSYALFFMFVPVILVAIYTVVYSYLEYRKEMK